MPEATVDEDAEPVFRQDDIEFARQVRTMQAKSVSQGMKGLADTDLGTGISTLDRRHVGRPLAGRELIRGLCRSSGGP